jgi:hypothetical protein
MIAKEEVLDRLVKNFWMETDTPQDDDYATPIADDLIMMKMRQTMKILPDGHIQLPTLWKEGLPQTENKYAKTRLFSLLGSKVMTSSTTLLNDYEEVIKKWEASGYIEKVQDENLMRPNAWYWAHFPILKEEKETTKIRPVFDGAAKFRGVCINDHIQTGPTVMNELVGVVHRFRQYNYAVTGDVKEMFLQVRVPPEEKDYLRFLWYKEGKVVIYRYTVHLFGKCDSPCVSMAAIFLQALTHKEKFPQAFETIAKASLVDDMADSRPMRLEITELVDQLIALYPLCAMEMRKFVGNSLELMQNLKP